MAKQADDSGLPDTSADEYDPDAEVVEGNPDAIPPTVASISEFIRAATKSTGEMERVWSAALDADAFRDGREELKARWASVIQMILSHLETVASGLKESDSKEEDLSLVQFGYPASLAEISSFVLDGSPETQWKQSQLAFMYACERLVEAVALLDKESASQIRFTGGVVTESRWWQAGAFSLIADRARAMAALLEEEAPILHDLRVSGKYAGEVPEPSVVRRRSWQMMKMSNRALTCGLYEASLIFQLQWIRALFAEALEIDDTDVPSPVSPHLGEVESLVEVAGSAALLEECCSRLGRGEAVDRAVSLVVAEGLNDALGNLLFADIPAPEGFDRPVDDG